MKQHVTKILILIICAVSVHFLFQYYSMVNQEQQKRVAELRQQGMDQHAAQYPNANIGDIANYITGPESQRFEEKLRKLDEWQRLANLAYSLFTYAILFFLAAMVYISQQQLVKNLRVSLLIGVVGVALSLAYCVAAYREGFLIILQFYAIAYSLPNNVLLISLHLWVYLSLLIFMTLTVPVVVQRIKQYYLSRA